MVGYCRLRKLCRVPFKAVLVNYVIIIEIYKVKTHLKPHLFHIKSLIFISQSLSVQAYK